MVSCTFSRHDLPNSRDDVRIGRAAADIPAHALANLGVSQVDAWRRHVGGCMTRPRRARFREHADRRADLAGSAVATLKSVVLDERSLKRMQGVCRAQALDRDDLIALVHYR